jgi:hypothetical protein
MVTLFSTEWRARALTAIKLGFVVRLTRLTNFDDRQGGPPISILDNSWGGRISSLSATPSHFRVEFVGTKSNDNRIYRSRIR